MKSAVSITGVVFLWMLFALSSCSTQDDMKAEAGSACCTCPGRKGRGQDPSTGEGSGKG